MPTIRVGENDLYAAISRRGAAAVVLIHGAGGSRLAWPPELRRLPGATVYTVDLPGHGRSSGAGRSRVDAYAGDVLGLMDGVGLESALVVGHSMGGAIAQMVALAAPDRVAGLLLVSTGPRLPVSDLILDGLKAQFEETVASISKWSWGPGADREWVAQGRQMMVEAGPEALLGDFVACDRFDVRDRLGEIVAPARVVTGEEDRMTPPHLGRGLAKGISHAAFSLIPGAGHMVILERPAAVAAVATEFMAQLARDQ
ncbi:MAG: alpha/beta fold hydrolase [Anaerolineae bacterium]|jgi:pimeloyl-ACP methyl ester carboxylesterase